MFTRRVVLAAALAAALVHPPAGAAQAANPPVAEPILRIGDTVPAFHATGLDGAVKNIDYPKGTTTIVVFFLSSCPTCHRMLPIWNEAFARRPKNMAMVGQFSGIAGGLFAVLRYQDINNWAQRFFGAGADDWMPFVFGALAFVGVVALIWRQRARAVQEDIIPADDPPAPDSTQPAAS